MDVPVADINQRIARQTRELRAGLGLSLARLAANSGVSRSMISLIERAQASPTAVVLERLACGLGVPLAQLFDPPPPQTPSPLSRHPEQIRWTDPGSGYVRRNVSPAHWHAPFRIVEVELPAGARIAYETATREPTIDQQVWVLSGRIEVVVGGSVHRLDCGDCLAMRLSEPIAFANRTRAAARYAVVLSAEPARPRPAAP